MDANGPWDGTSLIRVGDWYVPIGAPVSDVDGEFVGRVAGAIDDCLVVSADLFEDHVPFDVVAAFGDGGVRLAVTTAEIHRGDAHRQGK